MAWVSSDRNYGWCEDDDVLYYSDYVDVEKKITIIG
jgi:hypothetical protein